MRKLLLPLFTLLLSCSAWANINVEISGIKYSLNESTKEASVISKSPAYSGDVVIPSSVNYSDLPYSVTSIYERAFYNCTSLTSIVIPNSVTSIGNRAFFGCTGLTSVEIPNNITSIGYSTFRGCTSLTSIEIPNSVTSIGEYAFYCCSGLNSVKIPNSVISIGNSAFNLCTGLTSIEIPNCVTSIGTGAFHGTAWFDNQADGVVYTGKVAYTYKGTMPENTSISIKEGTMGIANNAFSGCKGLTSIEIPNSITYIGSSAFYGCTGLTSINIPNSVTSIGQEAFSQCRNLASLSVGSGVTNIGGEAFSYCDNLSYVNIHDIATWCNIDFGNYIGTNPLYYAHSLYLNGEKVINLVIPNGVTKIQGAFNYCTDFTSIKVCCNRPPVIDTYQFASTDKATCTLYVPKGTAMMYMSATGWNEFTNILEYEDGEDAHYITIRMGDGGELQQSVELGKIYIYKVKADEGWTVNTLTFNGQDMTSQLLDGQFSTPVITGDAELNVVFKQEASNIKSMKQNETSKVKVYAYNGTIKVAGAEDYTEVEVYNAGGMLVANGEGNCSISLDSGIYIVKVGNETFKVSL